MPVRQTNTHFFGDDASQDLQGLRGTPEAENLGPSVQDLLDLPENILIDFAASILASTITQRGLSESLKPRFPRWRFQTIPPTCSARDSLHLALPFKAILVPTRVPVMARPTTWP